MKLLFDHNLPPMLVSRLADLFLHSQHVLALGLDRASDLEIRDYARQNGFFIITKDADFSDLCVLLGFPTKSFGFVEETVRQQHLKSCCVNIATALEPWRPMR